MLIRDLIKIFNYKIQNRFYSISILAVLFTFFIFSSCNEDEDIGDYYLGEITDQLTIVNESDTINITIEQYRIESGSETLPYTIEHISPESDSVNLNLFVSFGSYNRTPQIIKEVYQISDTFYVWYSTSQRIYRLLNKNNSLMKPNTSPRAEFVLIDSVEIKAGKSKVINLSYKFYD